MLRPGKRGVVLILLLGTILLVTSLAGIISYLVLNQSRVGQHQINRIKAYYACMSGITLALEKLRVGDWGTSSYTLCNYTGSIGACTCDACDYDMPYLIDIDISAPDASGIRTINATANYTYTP